MPLINSEMFYSSAIEKFGITARGLNWSSKKNQLIRFEKILEQLPKDLSELTLIDAGCGFGDFYNYLLKKKRAPKEYIGIDSLLDMYSIASNNTAQNIIQADICKDKLPVGDYYICSGALNNLTKFETHQFIFNCYKSSRIAFIFNALCANKDSKTYNYMDKEQIKKISNEINVKKLHFQDDYLINDITVGFYR